MAHLGYIETAFRFSRIRQICLAIVTRLVKILTVVKIKYLQKADIDFKVVPQNDYLKVNPDSSSGIILETGPKAIDRETVCPTVFKPNEKCIMKDYTILAMNGFEVEQHRLRYLRSQ